MQGRVKDKHLQSSSSEITSVQQYYGQLSQKYYFG